MTCKIGKCKGQSQYSCWNSRKELERAWGIRKRGYRSSKG